MSQRLLYILQPSHSNNHKLHIVQDSHLFNVEHYHNHEKKKLDLITSKQQKIIKTKNTTNEEQQHLSCLMMINCPLPWHFPSIQNLATFHPLNYFFIQTST